MIWLFVAMFTAMPPQAVASEVCYLETPLEYQRRLGGASLLGPYSTREACEAVRRQNFFDAGRCRCDESSAGEATGRTAGGTTVVEEAAAAYEKIKELHARVLQSPAEDHRRNEVARRFLPLQRTYLDLDVQWSGLREKDRELSRWSTPMAMALRNEKKNIEAQDPGENASEAQLNAWMALVRQWQAKAEAHNERLAREGRAIAAGEAALVDRFREWKDQQALADFTAAAQDLLEERAAAGRAQHASASQVPAAADPNLDPMVVDARGVKPWSAGEREAELTRPVVAPPRTRTSEPPPPSQSPLHGNSGATWQRIFDAYDLYMTGSTEKEKLKAKAALEGARQAAEADIRQRIDHHREILWERDLLTKELMKNPAVAEAIQESEERWKAAERALDQLLRQRADADPGFVVDLVKGVPSRPWPGPKNPDGPLPNPMAEAKRRQELEFIKQAYMDAKRSWEEREEIRRFEEEGLKEQYFRDAASMKARQDADRKGEDDFIKRAYSDAKRSWEAREKARRLEEQLMREFYLQAVAAFQARQKAEADAR